MTSPRVVVVGGGVAGLGALRELVRLCPDADALLLERDARLGGLVETQRTPEGFLLEHGPDALVTHEPAGIGAVRALGLADEIVTGTGAPRQAFVARGAELVPLPPGLLAMSPATAWAMMRSPLLSARGKARLLAEPFVWRRAPSEDESVAEFFTRRFGREVAEALVDPLLRGIYATGTESLSMRAAMPRLSGLEDRFGSVALGVTLARMRRRERLPGAVSLRRGMGSLLDAMAAPLRGRVRAGVEVRAIERSGRGFVLRVRSGGAAEESIAADGVVLAAPAFASARLLEAIDPGVAGLLASITYAPHLSLSLGFARSDIPHALAGTGFIVPPAEGRFISACTWASQKWPDRAPEGSALIRVFARGAALDDREAVEAARADLRDLIGVEAPPVMVRAKRGERVLPARRVGHPALERRIAAAASALGPLALAGNALGTVGLSRCLEGGTEAARAVLRALAPGAEASAERA